MDGDSGSFQAQAAFQTNGAGAPTKVRFTRCNVTRTGTGLFQVSTSEDIADGSIAYSLGCGLDGGGAPVVCNVQKLSAFTWQITTSKVAGGASGTTANATWKASGKITDIIAVGAGFVADTDAAVVTTGIKYPLTHAATSLTLSVDVTANTYAAAGAGGVTTFLVYKNGVSTGVSITYNPAATGVQSVAVPIAYAVGDTFDLGVSNPGDGTNTHTATFSASMDFANSAVTAAALAAVDTTGAPISLTLTRVDPM